MVPPVLPGMSPMMPPLLLLLRGHANLARATNIQARSYSSQLRNAKATAKTMEAHPRLNERLFHGLFGKQITTYDDISCGMLAERQAPEGNFVLLPIIIKDAPNASIEDIHATIKNYKTLPLEKLEPYQQLMKLKNLPRWAVPLIQFFFRIHPRYTAGKVSTYAISSVIQRDGVTTGGHAPTFQTTFAPVNILQKPVVYEGEVAIRTILQMVLSVDHYLIDGMDAQRAIATLRGYLEDPKTLLG